MSIEGGRTLWRRHIVVHNQWWLALLLGSSIAGIGGYFALSFEPPGWSFAALAGTGFIGLAKSSKLAATHRLLVAMVCTAAIWFSYAGVRTWILDTPIISEAQYAGDLHGQILEYLPDGNAGYRLLLEVSPSNNELDAKRLQLRSRIAIENGLQAGDHVVLDAFVFPNPGAIRPGGYNSQAAAYFKEISGTGIITKSPIILKPSTTGDHRVEKLRTKISKRYQEALAPGAAGLATALTTGHRALIPDDVKEFMRRAGLAHLLAISGLHMALVVMGSFFILELLFVAIIRPGSRFRPRHIAALTAGFIGLGYFYLSGGSPSTQRALFMVSLMLLALSLDRKVLSLRSVLIAAFLLLLFRPDFILNAGFQLSFIATAALILAFERGWAHPYHLKHSEKWSGAVRRLGRFLAASFWITFISQMAIAPVAFYHFQEVSVVALLANLIAVPLVTLVIMSLLFLTLIFMPFGLEGILTWGLEIFLNILIIWAETLANLPGATVRVAAPPNWSLVFAIVVMMIVWLIRPKFKVDNFHRVKVGLWMAFAGTLASCVIVFTPRPIATAFIAGSRPNLAYASDDAFYLFGLRSDSFRTRGWQRYWGLSQNSELIRLKRRCDSDGCVLNLPGGERITFPLTKDAFSKDCQNPGLVIVPKGLIKGSPYRACPSHHVSARYLYQSSIESKGPYALYMENGIWRFENSIQGDKRPWNPYSAKSAKDGYE